MDTAYIDGSFAQGEAARISPQDLGFLRGYGVFEYLRTYQQRPFLLNEHLLRLGNSAKSIGLVLPHPLSEIEAIIQKLLPKEGEATFRIVLTGGVSQDGMAPTGTNALYIFPKALVPPPAHLYQGIHAITTEARRFLPEVKTLNYLPALIALEQARAKGAQEAIYRNARGHLLEATASNLLVFQGDHLIAPGGSEVLCGITRNLVLKLAAKRFSIEERPLDESEIPSLTEAFLTSSIKEIVPLISIDGKMIGDGTVGERTRWLREQYADYTRSTFD